ncbi:hypothetical protein ABW20_dc0102375 [Dactylellina cionopaga]|nr:hypothetical protein ABW20_dc0102375 [Dactylellina cionopaga]
MLDFSNLPQRRSPQESTRPWGSDDMDWVNERLLSFQGTLIPTIYSDDDPDTWFDPDEISDEPLDPTGQLLLDLWNSISSSPPIPTSTPPTIPPDSESSQRSIDLIKPPAVPQVPRLPKPTRSRKHQFKLDTSSLNGSGYRRILQPRTANTAYRKDPDYRVGRKLRPKKKDVARRLKRGKLR